MSEPSGTLVRARSRSTDSQSTEDVYSVRTTSTDADRIALVHLEAPGSQGTPEQRDDERDNLQGEATCTSHTKPHLTYFNGVALVISLQIGSGIFSAPSQVSTYVSSPALAISAWIFGGMLAYTGAMAFVELGIALPFNGGIQEYLRYAYSDFMGCLFTWVVFVIAKPASMAVICMIFADYFCRALIPTSFTSLVLEKIVALVGLAIITAINCHGIRSGALVANGFLILKLFLLFSLAVSGIVLATLYGATGIADNDGGWLGESNIHDFKSLWTAFGGYITSLFGVLFCYGGWETMGFVAGEMQSPARDMPRIANTCMAIMTAGSVLFNIALYSVVPFQEIRDTKTPVVELATRAFGTTGASLYSLMVAASAIGSLNAGVYATGRLYVSAAGRGYLPGCFRETVSEHAIKGDDHYIAGIFSRLPLPWSGYVESFANHLFLPAGSKALSRSIIFSACFATLYIVGGTFHNLITFIGITEYLFLGLTVAGLWRIRRRFPQLVTYKTRSWYVPVFCVVSLLLVSRGVITSPLQGLSIVTVAVVGWLLYRYIPITASNLVHETQQF